MSSESITLFEAMASRYSCRAFRETPLPETVVRDILARAARAPSGGNLQPWRIDAVTGAPLRALIDEIAGRIAAEPRGEAPQYRVYPEAMPPEMEARRFRVGEQLYASIGIPRADKAGRLAQFRRNFALFGAPVALFMSFDRRLGAPQWADGGMFLQSVSLLARAYGLHSCMQEAWSAWAPTVGRHLDIPATHILFCGVGIGYEDTSAPINRWRSERAGVEDFTRFRGFGAG